MAARTTIPLTQAINVLRELVVELRQRPVAGADHPADRPTVAGHVGWGFALEWNNQSTIVAMWVERGIRVLVPLSGTAAAATGYFAGKELSEEAIEF